MKRLVAAAAVLTVVVMVAPAMAGEGKKCEASTQDCLNYMAKNLKNRGWVGIEMDTKGGTDKMVITKVVENSPAEQAGFMVGDTLVAVDEVSLSIPRGICYALLGPNGAGKTTLSKMIGAVLPRDGGASTAFPVDGAQQAEPQAIATEVLLGMRLFGVFRYDAYRSVVKFMEANGYQNGDLRRPRPDDTMFLFGYD